MADLSLAFDILARDKASKVLDDVGGKADTLGTKLGGVGGKAKLLAGGAAVGGIAALGGALVQGVKDAASFEKLQAKTAAVIESTGNAANISVEGVQSLAGSLESISGVDEEEIINSQNVLATFTKIKNNGPDKVFDDAAKAALNMSTALGTDLQGASMQVGKALNDPIKGVASLSRAGVQFTEQQKEQIKAMVAAGDTAGAQRMILGELETQFGGAAEAAGSGFGGAMARLQDAVGDAFRDIGMELIPVLTSLAEWLARNLPGAIEDFKVGLGIVSDFMETKVWPVVQTGVGIFRDYVLPVLGDIVAFIRDPLIPAIGQLIEWFVSISTKITEVAITVGTKVGEIVTFFTDLPGNLARVAGDVWGFLRESFRSVINFIITAWNALDFKLPSFEGLEIAGQTVIPGWEGSTIGVPDMPLWGTGDSGKTGRSLMRTMHAGGMVTPWGVEPLRSDEVMAKLQIGETVLPRGGVAPTVSTGHAIEFNVINPVPETPSDSVRSLRRMLAEL